jgi:carboxypeptidase family protein/Big-like domain-containing protein
MKTHCLIRTLAAFILLVATTACTSNSTPASPTAASATVSAVALTRATISASVVQMTATAALTDGTTRDVTSAATWTTSNPAIAVVSSGGRVTILSSGDVDVRATYQNVTGSMRLALTQKFALSGIVTEGAPAERPLANARVAIIDGADAGAVVSTDATGAFRFDTVTAGVMSMEVTRDGYLLWRATNLTMDRDRQIDLELFPVPPTNAAGASATARCGDGTWSWAPTRGDACTTNGGVIYGVCPGPLCDGRFR